MTGPISPKQAKTGQAAQIPEAVFEVFNDLLSKRVSNGDIVIQHDEVVAALVKRGIDKDEIFANNWLDVEPAYRAKGWHVTYDKPAYCETYRATWTFRASRMYRQHL